MNIIWSSSFSLIPPPPLHLPLLFSLPLLLSFFPFYFISLSSISIFLLLPFLLVLVMEPKASGILGQCPVTRTLPASFFFALINLSKGLSIFELTINKKDCHGFSLTLASVLWLSMPSLMTLLPAESSSALLFPPALKIET